MDISMDIFLLKTEFDFKKVCFGSTSTEIIFWTILIIFSYTNPQLLNVTVNFFVYLQCG